MKTQTLPRNKHQNSINTINVFLKGRSWVFNDEQVDLIEEPFVAGADTLLDRMANGNEEVQVTFSATKFPGVQLTLNYMEGKVENGTTYFCEELQHQLWLCPALGKYFAVSPKQIFIQYK